MNAHTTNTIGQIAEANGALLSPNYLPSVPFDDSCSGKEVDRRLNAEDLENVPRHPLAGAREDGIANV